MSYFTKKIAKTYTFENDEVKVSMRRLKKKDFIRISPHLGEPDDNGKFKLKFADQMAFIEIAGGMLIKYVDSFEGLKDNEGNAISLEETCGEEEGEAYFMPLLSEMFSDLMSNSFSGKDDEKKLEELPEDISVISNI